jgi:hypothetical protein
MERPRRSESLEMAEVRRKLDAAHRGLLRVHKAIIDHERTRYERSHGTVGGPLEFLQLVLNHPWFAWLRPMSELTVQIDEFTSSRETPEQALGTALLTRARELLVPDDSGEPFARQYHRAIQESPDVAMAHGEWKQLIGG